MPETRSAAGISETPLMKQYFAVKAKYPGALILFRVGDFYETFGEDAVKASKILDIILTRRANGAASEVELAGFPHHALDSYLPKLIRAGQRVAICDQLEDPKMAKGIVKRGVTELVTPGLSFHENVLNKRQNNFLCSVYFGHEKIGISFLDLSTGEYLLSAGNESYIENLLQGFAPSEIIFGKSQKQKFTETFGDKFNTFHLDDWIYNYDFGYEKLINHFNTQTLKGFGVEGISEGIIAAGAVLQYLGQTEHKEIGHISSLARIEEENFVWLDRFTIRNLELVSSQLDDGIPLVKILDETVTPMGARMMRKWLLMPLKDITKIGERLDTVESLFNDTELCEKIANCLKPAGDLERLISKVAVGRINPRELLQLKRSLKSTIPLKKLLAGSGNERLVRIGMQLYDCDYLLGLLESRLMEDAPLVTNQGGLIRDGVDQELDDLRKIAYSGKDYLLRI
ncbi:MAG TPA: hypothetical protein VI583_13455, partial [Cyclobacteriaceae bacterium]|nr:hypothetical protein [Cyclobacteriaceae bacterium]